MFAHYDIGNKMNKSLLSTIELNLLKGAMAYLAVVAIMSSIIFFQAHRGLSVTDTNLLLLTLFVAVLFGPPLSILTILLVHVWCGDSDLPQPRIVVSFVAIMASLLASGISFFAICVHAADC